MKAHRVAEKNPSTHKGKTTMTIHDRFFVDDCAIGSILK